jgi:hypothetical protein
MKNILSSSAFGRFVMMIIGADSPAKQVAADKEQCLVSDYGSFDRFHGGYSDKL